MQPVLHIAAVFLAYYDQEYVGHNIIVANQLCNCSVISYAVVMATAETGV